MRVLLLLIPLLQVELLFTKDLEEVSAYFGESVTLPSGVDPSWNLSLIEWSILTNTTFIATHRSGNTNVNRFWRYKERLKLNISSGDLGISGLTREDAMEYTVDLKNTEKQSATNKVRLIIKDRLSQPIIQQFLGMAINEGHCHMALQCTSPDRGAVFTWQAPPTTNISFWTSSNNISYLLASFGQDNNTVNFTCTTSMAGQNTSSVVTTKRCQEEKLKEARSSACGGPGGYILAYVFGSVTVVIVAMIVVYCFKARARESGSADKTENMALNDPGAPEPRPGASTTQPPNGMCPTS